MSMQRFVNENVNIYGHIMIISIIYDKHWHKLLREELANLNGISITVTHLIPHRCFNK